MTMRDDMYKFLSPSRSSLGGGGGGGGAGGSESSAVLPTSGTSMAEQQQQQQHQHSNQSSDGTDTGCGDLLGKDHDTTSSTSEGGNKLSDSEIRLGIIAPSGSSDNLQITSDNNNTNNNQTDIPQQSKDSYQKESELKEVQDVTS
ncbi:unnamed protein product [Trichobilharzia regenti]|nr:unnamed protein product [Trichobilharzia regenti]